MEHGPSGASGQPAAQSVHTGAAVSAWHPHPRTEAATAAGPCLTPRTAPTGCACRVSAWESGDRPLCPCPALGRHAHPEQSSLQGLLSGPTSFISSILCPHDLLDHPLLSPVSSSSFPLFPLTDKRTLNDPKSHRKFHFMTVLFLLGIPGSPWLACHGCVVKGRESGHYLPPVQHHGIPVPHAFCHIPVTERQADSWLTERPQDSPSPFCYRIGN